MFPETIETDRLRLRRLCRETIDPLDAYEHYGRSDTIEEETRHLTWEPHATPKETRDAFVSFEERWDDAEDAVYAIFPREGEAGAGEFAGTAGLHVDWEKRAAGLGIWLRKGFWGRGYSGERAGAMLQLAFDRLDLDVVSIGYLPGNERSKRAIEKYVERYGGRYEGLLRNWAVRQGDPSDCHRYTISRAEWREAVGDDREARFVDG
ncbi:GNAT family N-acetyltransferase [Halegenticoccus tardaugens]|uniref:GNAT family N-acetyltransferase n=1 Tax=Halegenticoccus tardaugens TaxID=2071624 RepID=UPI00100C30B8|nr:GNAT family protein [Halegenticoccus tardaugens]